MTSLQIFRRKRAETEDVFKAAAIGLKAAGPIGGAVAAIACFIFCKGEHTAYVALYTIPELTKGACAFKHIRILQATSQGQLLVLN